MKKILFTSCLLFTLKLYSQLSGTFSVPGTYSSIASAIGDLNTQGVSAGVTVYIASGYTETAVSTGYSLYASGSALAPVVFKKNGTGTNPVIYAYSSGNKTPGAAVQDGIFRLIGCDYITIDGLSFVDLNISNPATMEFGIGFFKASANDGCQYNTIKNCFISLSRINNSSGSGPAVDGSRCIDIVNALPSAHNQHLVTGSPSGSNSYNHIYGNLLTNCNTGVSINGFAGSTFSLCDQQNEIGGNSVVAGNRIFNFGGGGLNASAGLRVQSQYDLLIGYNTVDNNTGNGANHAATLRGIYSGVAPGANCSIINNTITVRGGGTSSQLLAVENLAGAAGSSNTITIADNLIQNSSYKTATSGSFYGISNSASAAYLVIKSNSFYNNSTHASSGSTYLVYNSGAVSQSLLLRKNMLTFKFHSNVAYTGTAYGLYNNGSASTCTAVIDSNSFSHFYHTAVPGSGTLYFINNSTALAQLSIAGNRFTKLLMNHSGSEYFIFNNALIQNTLAVTNNSVISYSQGAAAGNLYGYYSSGNAAAAGLQKISANVFSGISSLAGGTGNFYAIYSADGNSAPYPRKVIENNLLQDISIKSTGIFYGIYLSDAGDAGSAKGSSVSSNTISGVSFSGAVTAMYLASPSSSAIAVKMSDNLVTDVAATATAQGIYIVASNAGAGISCNKIAGITSFSNSAFGIICAGTTSTSLFNNLVGNIFSSSAGGASRCNGIFISSGSRAELDYNSVFIHGSSTGAHFGSNALFASSSASILLTNNILVNAAVPTGTGVTAAFRRSSSTMTSYLAGSDRNLFYAGTPGLQNVIFDNGTKYQSLSSFTLFASPREGASVSQGMQFKSLVPSSPNYLHVTDNSVTACESGGMAAGTRSDDFDKDIRFGFTGYAGSGSATDIGADEFDLNTTPCSSVSAASVFPLTASLCAGATVALYGSGFTRGTGIVQQWKISSTSGGTFSNVAGGSGGGAAEYYSGVLNAGTYFYRLETTCTLVPVTAISPEVTLVVHPVPTISLPSASVAACVGQTVQLSASSFSNSDFLWRGPLGYYSGQQDPILSIADTSEAGNYTVVAERYGCISAPAQIVMKVSRIDLDVSIARSSVCTGESCTITALSAGGTYSWSTGASTASVVLTPTVSGSYSVTASNSLNCSVTASVNIVVTNPVIQANGAVSCLPVQQATLSASAFSPSAISWYKNALDSTAIFSGALFTVSNSANTTYFAEAASGFADSVSLAPPSSSVQVGQMFDVLAINDLEISGFDLPIANSGTGTIEIWKRSGSYFNFSSSNAGWILAGNFTVSAPGGGALSSFKIPLTKINAGGRVGFYIVSVSSLSVNILAALPAGTTVVQNGNITVCAGIAGPSYFNVAASPAAFAGIVRYNVKGCKSVRIPVTHTISAPPTLTVNADPQQVCAGRSVTLSASGASSYSWTGIGAGNVAVIKANAGSVFTVTGKNAEGCLASQTVSLQVLPLPIITIATAGTIVCPSSATTFSAQGAITYTWSTGAIGQTIVAYPPAASVYTVTGAGSNNCINTNSIAVTTKTVPALKTSQNRTLVCAGEEVILSASGASTFTWYPSAVSVKTISVNPYVTSVYNVAGSSVNGCTSIAMALVTVDECAAVISEDLSAVLVFPNPATSFVTIKHPDLPGLKLTVYNDLGSEVDVEHLHSNLTTVNVRYWRHGIYLFVLHHQNMSRTIKIVVGD